MNRYILTVFGLLLIIIAQVSFIKRKTTSKEELGKLLFFDPVLSKESLDFFTSLYVGKNILAAVNPIEAPLNNFPPTLILVGSNEILLDDSKTMFSKIKSKHPLTRLVVSQNQTHVWLMDDIRSEPSKKAVAEIKSFLTAGPVKNK